MATFMRGSHLRPVPNFQARILQSLTKIDIFKPDGMETFIHAVKHQPYVAAKHQKGSRRLLNGDRDLVDASAHRLETLGEEKAAADLRKGDLTAVALAARLIPL